MIRYPYTLPIEEQSDRSYAEVITNLTDHLREEAFIQMPSLHRDDNGVASLPISVMMDALVFGVLWQEYATWATKIELVDLNLVAELSEIRIRFPESRQSIDRARAESYAGFLKLRPSVEQQTPEVSTANLDRFFVFLEALGEYHRIVDHLREFVLNNVMVGVPSFRTVMQEILAFSSFFASESGKFLGAYTSSCCSYLRSLKQEPVDDAESILRSRNAVEYHLNMVVAQWMQQENLQAYVETDRLSVVLPHCLCPTPEDCEAEWTGNRYNCLQCKPNCPVSSVQELCNCYSAEMVLIEHASGFASWIKDTVQVENHGIVGIACVSNLIEGGFEAQRRSIPVTCVPLNRPGCSQWHKQYEGSQLNLAALETLLSIHGKVEKNESIPL